MPGPLTEFKATSPYARKLRVGVFATGIIVAGLLAGCGGGGGTPPATTPIDVTLKAFVSGSGSVASSPAGIDCGNTCTAPFVQGNTVTLTATPNSGYIFGGWGGACANSGTAPTCDVTMGQNQSVSATFSTQSTPGVKPNLIGLVTMGDESWLANGGLPQNRLLEANAHPGVYVAAVIEATWSQIEPQTGMFDDTVIDAALQNIAAYNAHYPTTPLVGKLRIFAGVNTPSWVLTQVGSVTLTNNNISATFPNFWTPGYSALWTQLQQHLASVYDGNPLMGEVAISVCSSITAEPFVVPGSATNQQALADAGYTAAQMEQCLSDAPNDYGAWHLTPLDYTFNPTVFDSAGDGGSAFAIQVMQQFRQALGTRAVLANHDMNDPILGTEAQDYAEFQALYDAAQATSPPTLSPLEFQTIGPTQVDFATTIPFAISTYHPTEIEMWNTTTVPGGLAPVTLAELQQWAAQIQPP